MKTPTATARRVPLALGRMASPPFSWSRPGWASAPSTCAVMGLSTAADDALEADGTLVTVAGWGNRTPLAGGGLLTTNRLQEVDLAVVGDDECGDANGGFDAATGVCAAALLKDSCQGDSGGPLFATEGGRQVQIGVVS